MVRYFSYLVFVITLGSLYFYYVKTVTFVPFKIKGVQISSLENHETTTLPKHFYELKLKVPKIKKINSVSELKSNQIILLPWNTVNHRLEYTSINGKSFYQSSDGTIQIKTVRLNEDGYHLFLKNRIEMTIGGTVVLARGVHKVIQKRNNINYPWEGTKHLFKDSDINVINFKSPLVKNFTYPKSSWVLTGKEVYAEGLKNSNIHLAAVAGNHMGDAKIEGFLETLEILKMNNIMTVGGGPNKNKAYSCQKIMKKDKLFGFLAFNNVHGSIAKANHNQPGIAWLDLDALESIKQCEAEVDFLTIMVNWGIEYTHLPRKKEREFAKKMVESGADLIIGDQAHWVQAHEKINDTHVSYGLGNYIFDQHWSKKTTQGIIQKFIVYNNKIIAIKTIPIKLTKTGGVKELDEKSDEYQNILNAYHLEMDTN